MQKIKRACNPRNYGGLRGQKIKYIVIHYTAGDGDTAENNGAYFATNAVGASAHWFVDENYALLSVPEEYIAYHCGNSVYRHPECRNTNSIGIELCSEKDRDGVYYFTTKTILNAVQLTRELMKRYRVPPENVIRHFDVTGKECPAPFVGAGIEQWQEFKEMIAMVKYDRLEELPEWAKPAVEKLVQKGYLKGTDTGLDLSQDMVRMLVILDRTGVFG